LGAFPGTGPVAIGSNARVVDPPSLPEIEAKYFIFYLILFLQSQAYFFLKTKV
jgi:hypothetical protein